MDLIVQAILYCIFSAIFPDKDKKGYPRRGGDFIVLDTDWDYSHHNDEQDYHDGEDW